MICQRSKRTPTSGRCQQCGEPVSTSGIALKRGAEDGLHPREGAVPLTPHKPDSMSRGDGRHPRTSHIAADRSRARLRTEEELVDLVPVARNRRSREGISDELKISRDCAIRLLTAVERAARGSCRRQAGLE